MAVDLLLLGDVEHGEGLVGVDQVADAVVDDGCAGGVDECSDRLDAAGTLEEVACAADVDFVVEGGITGQGGWGGGMDDDFGLNESENFLNLGFH